MKAFLTILQLAGFFIPLVSAVIAYIRYQKVGIPVPEGPKSYEWVTFMVETVIPRLVEDKARAVTGPAIVALAGLFLSTAAGIIPLWVNIT